MRGVSSSSYYRMIFERMRNYCIYRIACTTNLLFFFFFAMMFINPNTISQVTVIRD